MTTNLKDLMKTEAFDYIFGMSCMNQIDIKGLNKEDYESLRCVVHSCMKEAYNHGLKGMFEEKE